VHSPLFLNPTAAAASDSIGATANGGTANRQEPQSILFFIKKLSISIEAQSLYIAEGFLPFYAFTLRCLVPRCCRVTLQPVLVGHSSISFDGLQGAPTFVPKPDCNEKPIA